MIKESKQNKIIKLMFMTGVTFTLGLGINNIATFANSNKNTEIKRVENYSHNKGLSGGNELSKVSMYKTLRSHFDGDKSNKSTIKYAVNHAKVNWKKQALNYANGYHNDKYIPKSLRPSKKDTYGMLRGKSSSGVTSGGFTKSQANYAMKHLK